jgi:EF-P beta-lysylation protein EpmB
MRVNTIRQVPAWQSELAQAITDPAELCKLLELDRNQLAMASMATDGFPLKVPRSYVSRMQKGNPDDPLLLQVLPLAAELETTPGYTNDPVADHDSMVAPGILHKYHGRALLLTTGACAVHCRYCFRRHFPYSDANPASNQWQDAFDYLSSTPDISEVILSGGDPLSLSDHRLKQLIVKLEQIPSIKTLRIHTRLPVVLPQRITRELLDCLSTSRLHRVLVIHANHPNEIDENVKSGLLSIKSTGATLLNQSVLLNGINEDPEILINLSKTLFDSGVMPYYLHMLDPVAGSSHFEVKEEKAIKIMDMVQGRLPGYLVPRLVREVPGKRAKTLLL